MHVISGLKPQGGAAREKYCGGMCMLNTHTVFGLKLALLEDKYGGGMCMYSKELNDRLPGMCV
jgi:hypothetical protein